MAVLAGAGCAERDQLRLVPVAGNVTVDGIPLSSAGVAFHPDASKGNTVDQMPAATTNAEGNFELITQTRKGAPAGWYKVVVIPYSDPPSKAGRAPPGQRPNFNTKYQSLQSTDLSVEVTSEAAPGAHDLKLTK